jgi:HD-GYP domain-containing protein (c-di-GMP phosphodiesterase class II)
MDQSSDRGSRTLSDRVKAALERLGRSSSVSEDRGDVLAISFAQHVVVVADESVLLRADAFAERLVAQALREERALIVVGDERPELESLIARGIFDLVARDASTTRLMLALRNALELLDVKERAENRARWLRRYRYEAGTLIECARDLGRERDIDRLLAAVLERCRFLAAADAGSIYIVEGTDPDITRRQLRFKLSQNESLALPSGEFVMPISMRSIAGSVAITRKLVAIEDVYNLPADSPFQFDPSFDKRVGYRTKSILAVPLVSAQDEVIGVVQLINRKRDPRERLRTPDDAIEHVVPFDDRSIELVASLAAQAGVALENATLYEEIRRILDGFVRASVQAIEQRDPTTSGHSQRVATLSLRLADAVTLATDGPYRGMRFSPSDLRQLEYASLLHDFGKIGVREQVLVKAKKLYPWQMELLRARFDLLHRTAQVQSLERKLELYAKNASVAELAALEEEAEVRAGQIEAMWALVREANEPSVLPQEASSRLDELGRMTYQDLRGAVRPYLDADELRCLKVPRGSLTQEEYREIQSHVTHTFEFLSRIPWGKTFAQVPQIAGCHHEKLNGRGYPRGLSGDEIPVGSRIMAIADIFDALTASDRPYKKAVPVDRALDILHAEVRDGALDGELVRLFVESGAYRAVLT